MMNCDLRKLKFLLQLQSSESSKLQIKRQNYRLKRQNTRFCCLIPYPLFYWLSFNFLYEKDKKTVKKNEEKNGQKSGKYQSSICFILDWSSLWSAAFLSKSFIISDLNRSVCLFKMSFGYLMSRMNFCMERV